MDMIIVIAIFASLFLLIATFSIALIVFFGGLALGDMDDFHEEI
jgi:hypothetical protein